MSLAERIITQLAQGNWQTPEQLTATLRQLFNQAKQAPLPKATLITAYRQLVKDKKMTANEQLEKLLVKRAVRTLSGVTVITVLTKPFVCPGKCVYCPTEPNMPKSYLSNEPAAQRAVRHKFDPFDQVQKRILALENNGHKVDKLEVIVLGGTWSAYEKQYQTWFVTQLFYAANTFQSYSRTQAQAKGRDPAKSRTPKTLAEEQKINETAQYRVIGLTLETRPDHIDEAEVKRLRQLGCTRIQLGVQHTDNKILELIRRGDTYENAVTATRLLKETGFKVDHHYMPDLPSSTPAKDLAMFQQVYTDGTLMPDQVKIYPTVVNEYAQLWHWYKNGRYKPYTEKELQDLLLEIKKITPPYVRINRLIRDIPEESIIAGNKITNLRQYLQEELKRLGQPCKCIRCREPRADVSEITNSKLQITKYKASAGQEYFLSYESPDNKTIYAFLRLRFNKEPAKNFLPELQGAALVRELHVYGQMIPVDSGSSHAQNLGLGRQLMAKAEELTKEQGLKKIAVIAGIGVREYYKKLGYSLEGTYMVKYL